LESGVETVQQFLFKLCPFFDDLDEIYGHWICNNIPFRMQIGNEATIEKMQEENTESIEDENLLELSNQETSHLPLPTTEETLKTKSNVREKKNNQLFVLGQDLKEIGNAEIEIQREKLVQKNSHFLQKYELEKQKLELEKQKLQNEFELEKERILSTERIERYKIDLQLAKTQKATLIEEVLQL